MRRRLEAGLAGLIALTCVAFAAELVRGPARAEEKTMRGWLLRWRSGTSGGRDEVRALGRDEVLRLPDAREGSWIRVQAGTVLVTREGDPEDHVLVPGAELRLPGRGRSVAWALEPSRVEVRRGSGEQAREQPAVARQLSAAP